MKAKHTQQQHAKDMFLHTSLSRLDIAEAIGIDRKTLYTWIKEGEWIRLKHLAGHSPISLTEQYYKQLHEMNTSISARQMRPYANKEEAEIIKKLTNTIKTIKGTRQPVSETIKTFMELSTNINGRDEATAKKIVIFMDEYIKDRVKDAKLDDDFTFRREENQFGYEYDRMLAEEEVTNNDEETVPTYAPASPTALAPHTPISHITPSAENGVILPETNNTPQPLPIAAIQPPEPPASSPQKEQNNASPHIAKNNHPKHVKPHYYKKDRAA